MFSNRSTTVRVSVTAVAIVALVLFVLVLFSRNRPAADPAQFVRADSATDLLAAASPALVRPSAVVEAATSTPAPKIAVDVVGAVEQPGVYWLDPDARVADAVQAAGGFAPDANSDGLNKAAPITDGQQIRVPRVGENVAAADQSSGDDASTGGATDSEDVIDLNRADADALDSLPGIGPATAEAILAYREANGPFKRSEDIQNVKGIGPAVYAKIEDAITVGP